jgi:pimeloyl-ACP methyl ester carboxylesterase
LNGVPIYFEVHGNGQPLLLLHGFGGCSQDWAEAALKHQLGNSTTAHPLREWGQRFQLIIPDMRGHGRSFPMSSPDTPAGRAKAFRHDEAAGDMLALLDHLEIQSCKALGVSGGGNVLLHVATKQPERVEAMVLVSGTSYFPAQARAIMRQYAESMSIADREVMRRRHPGGEAQIEAILASTKSFADSYDDLNFTPPLLSTIKARTLIVQGDRDALYPLEISVEMARAIPQSSLWIVPGGGHGPIGGERWPEFVRTAIAFLEKNESKQ